jgi:DNA-binding NarL/FixJ family response regulator
MDLSMPKMNGIEAIKEIKKGHPEIKIIALTVHDEEEYIHSVLESGAQGYVLKDAIKSELMLAIKNVLLGKKHISSGISEKVIEGYLSEKAIPKTDAQSGILSQ